VAGNGEGVFLKSITSVPFPWEGLPEPVIGVDEVGRGCLAGPVYAAAVIIDPSKPYGEFRDSKLLSESRRERMAESILLEHRVGVGFATVEEIDQVNILQASFLAMKRALLELKLRGGTLLVDGHLPIPSLSPSFVQTTVVQGDRRAKPISAASIVAKVARDRLMRQWHEAYPEYGFSEHKGYGTKSHLAAIALHGPTPLHRKTFRGVREHVASP
jgi:ribonuclease HII